MRLKAVCLALLGLAVIWPLRANTAVTPTPLGEGWLKRHEEFVTEAKAGGIDLLFLGDSLADDWRYETQKDIPRGKRIWDREYAPLHAANFGISGDRTQHLLWRLQHGEIDGISPKVVVLMIGNNNAGLNPDKVTLRNTAPEIIEGIRAVVAEIRKRLPSSRILLLGVLPRGKKDNPVWPELAEVNATLKTWDDGEHVRYLDLLAGFLTADGELSRDLMPDLSHPDEKGFQVWADEMRPLLRELMGLPPTTANR